MARAKRKAPPHTAITPEQQAQRQAEYNEAYEVMGKCRDLRRFKEVMALLPKRRAMAPEYPEAGLPPGMTETDVLKAIEALQKELTRERREWMCGVMGQHMMTFNPSIYLADQDI